MTTNQKEKAMKQLAIICVLVTACQTDFPPDFCSTHPTAEVCGSVTIADTVQHDADSHETTHDTSDDILQDTYDVTDIVVEPTDINTVDITMIEPDEHEEPLEITEIDTLDTLDTFEEDLVEISETPDTDDAEDIQDQDIQEIEDVEVEDLVSIDTVDITEPPDEQNEDILPPPEDITTPEDILLEEELPGEDILPPEDIPILTCDSCDDENPCTVDSCVLGTCTYVFTEGLPCDDGDACTLTDMCSDHTCHGTDKPCDDSNECTDDYCEEGTCKKSFHTGICDDLSDCTTSDHCESGDCVGTNVPTCVCANNNDCAPLDTDNNLCNGTFVCDNTACVYVGFTITCQPTNTVCMSVACNPNTGTCEKTSTHENLSCIPDDGCIVNATCQNGFCEGTLALCNDDIPCTTDSCENGGCINIPHSNQCNDNNQCTSDLCSTTSGCTFTTVTLGPCNDGDACTVSDTCINGSCKGILTCECATDSECTSKDDGNKCNGTFKCVDHQCLFDTESIVTCDQSNDTTCLESTCIQSTGLCSYVAVHNIEPCNDGDACTTEDYCNNGACIPFITVSCNDFNDCTTDSCNPATGCVNAPQNFAICNDSTSATSYDSCDATGTCKGVKPFKITFELADETLSWQESYSNENFGSWRFLIDPEAGSSPSPDRSLQFKSLPMTLGGTLIASATSGIIEIPHSQNPTLTFYRAGSLACSQGKVEVIIEEVVVHTVCDESSSWKQITVPLPKNVATTRVTVRFTFTAGTKPDSLWYRFDLFESHP